MRRYLCVWFADQSSPSDRSRPRLESLAQEFQRYSPFVSVESDSLILDVDGDEQSLLKRIRRDFKDAGVGLADTPGAAWAVAHFGRKRIVPPGETDALLPLPVEALRLSVEAIEALRAFDIRQVGQLVALPRHSLIRFGSEVIERLQQAFGQQAELLTPVHQPQPITAAFTFDDPPNRFTLETVIARLVDTLAEQARGITGVKVELNCERNVVFPVGMVAPSDHLSELIVNRLERLPGELQSVRLTVTETMVARQPLLFGGQDFSRLIDRLRNRLGNERVTRPKLLPEVQPELAVRWDAVNSVDLQPTTLAKLPRPLWLLTPERIRVDWDSRIVRGNRVYSIIGYHGPERIETGWWRNGDVRRDYYDVETDDGRFWLFQRIREEDWFLHGEFD